MALNEVFHVLLLLQFLQPNIAIHHAYLLNMDPERLLLGLLRLINGFILLYSD